MEGIIWTEERAEFHSCFFCLANKGVSKWITSPTLTRTGGKGVGVRERPIYLLPAVRGKLDSVIGYCLMDISVFCAKSASEKSSLTWGQRTIAF